MTLRQEDTNGFTAHLKLRDNRDITIARHIRALKDLCAQINEFSFLELKNLLEQKKLAGMSSGTLRNHVSTIHLYAQYKQLDEALIHFPLSLFPRHQQVIRRTLSDEQIEAFLNVPSRKWLSRDRFKMFNAFWSLCAFCALRPGECARLKKSDIDISNKQIILRPEITKTKQFSTIPLFPNIFELIRDYVEVCPTEYLFPSKHGGVYESGKESVISQKDWSLDFDQRLKQCSIAKVPGLVPYSLRHSCATRWIANNMSVYIVRRLMRHVKIEQTLVYEHMTSNHLVPTVVKYDPLVRKHADPTDILDLAKENIESFGLTKDARFSEDFRCKLNSLFFDEQSRLSTKKGGIG